MMQEISFVVLLCSVLLWYLGCLSPFRRHLFASCLLSVDSTQQMLLCAIFIMPNLSRPSVWAVIYVPLNLFVSVMYCNASALPHELMQCLIQFLMQLSMYGSQRLLFLSGPNQLLNSSVMLILLDLFLFLSTEVVALLYVVKSSFVVEVSSCPHPCYGF
jgi:hypothetical protein